MINILIKFQLHRFKCIFNPRRALICSSNRKCWSSSPLNCKIYNLRNTLRTTTTSNCKNIKYSYTTSNNKLGTFSSEKKNNENSIIYNGSITYQVKGVKMFTCITSLGGIMVQPFIVQNLLNGSNMPLGVAVFCCVGFFTFLTPFFIHVLTRKYVTEIWYNSATDTYTATVLSFFLQKVNITFKIEDVTIPTSLPIFSTMSIKGRPVFIISDSFLEIEHYIKMMGYDKPLDMKLNSVEKNLKMTENKSK